MSSRGTLGTASGAALYIGSLIGPGVLLVPALAARAAGPASVISWGALLLLSAPLAIIFAVLGTRMPGSGGVASYVEAGFGRAAGLVTGGWFLSAVLIGAPAVSMIGGFYVADLTGSGTGVAAGVALAIFGIVLATNALGLRVSAKLQLLAATVLTVLVALAVGTALPSGRASSWSPFVPHGWWAIGTAGNILIWLFVGWESVAQLTGEFRDPRRQLPRAMTVAFLVVAVLYSGLAVATVIVDAHRYSNVPLADLMAAGLGGGSRGVTTVLAVALTMATMNVYVASSARLASALSIMGALPSWLGRDHELTVPRRPLVVIGVIGLGLLAPLAFRLTGTEALIRATSACFIMVYVAATASAVRILGGRLRAVAILAAAVVIAIAIFSGWYLLVPAVSSGVFLALMRRTRQRAQQAPGSSASQTTSGDQVPAGRPTLARESSPRR